MNDLKLWAFSGEEFWFLKKYYFFYINFDKNIGQASLCYFSLVKIGDLNLPIFYQP